MVIVLLILKQTKPLTGANLSPKHYTWQCLWLALVKTWNYSVLAKQWLVTFFFYLQIWYYMPKLAKKCKPWHRWVPLNHKGVALIILQNALILPMWRSWQHFMRPWFSCSGNVHLVCFQPYNANDARTDHNGIEHNNISQNGKTAWNENLVGWLFFILPFWYKAKCWWFHCSFNYELK